LLPFAHAEKYWFNFIVCMWIASCSSSIQCKWLFFPPLNFLDLLQNIIWTKNVCVYFCQFYSIDQFIYSDVSAYFLDYCRFLWSFEIRMCDPTDFIFTFNFLCMSRIIVPS
jgi:hypothetical protein